MTIYHSLFRNQQAQLYLSCSKSVLSSSINAILYHNIPETNPLQLLSSRGSMILVRRLDVDIQVPSSIKYKLRLPQELPRRQHEISLRLTILLDDLASELCVGHKPHSSDEELLAVSANGFANLARQVGLEGLCDGDALGGRVAAAADVENVNAQGGQ